MSAGLFVARFVFGSLFAEHGSLPQNTMMRAIDAIDARVVPAQHRQDIAQSRAAEVFDGHT